MPTYSLLFGHAHDEPIRPRRADRLTLRLPAALRGRIESSAARDGLSADEWATIALARALDGTPTP